MKTLLKARDDTQLCTQRTHAHVWSNRSNLKTSFFAMFLSPDAKPGYYRLAVWQFSELRGFKAASTLSEPYGGFSPQVCIA